jgi:hypothetical protein
MKGYKIFNPDFTCRGHQFEENKTYEIEGEIKLCGRGFHFCEKLSHCFEYYSFDHRNIICEVEALGEIDRQKDGDSKVCTNKIHIGKRLTWEQVLAIANEGLYNTGHSNTGDRNTGYSNTGYSNTGDRNTGDRNTGYRNTGDWNTGDRNTGYSNTGDRNTGVFCTGAKHMDFFNKKSTWTEEKFLTSKVYGLLCEVNTKMWVYPNEMTAEEKKKYPSYETCDGYLKDIPFKQAFQNRWHNWSEENKNEFLKLPNFDSKIFELITGVKVTKKKKK